MRELPVESDGVEALPYLLDTADHPETGLSAHLRLEHARGREHADARLGEHRQEGGVVELPNDSRPNARIREPALEGPAERSAVVGQEERGAVQRARKAPTVGGSHSGCGEERSFALSKKVMKGTDLDGAAGLGVG